MAIDHGAEVNHNDQQGREASWMNLEQQNQHKSRQNDCKKIKAESTDRHCSDGKTLDQ
jgi:hypothetical protein